MSAEHITERRKSLASFDPEIMARLETEWIRDGFFSEIPVLQRNHSREVEGLMYQFGLNRKNATRAIECRNSGLESEGPLGFIGRRDLEKYYKILSQGSGLNFDYKTAKDIDLYFQRAVKQHGLISSSAAKVALCHLFSIIYSVPAENLEPAMDARINAFKEAHKVSEANSVRENMVIWKYVEQNLVEYYTLLINTIK